MMGLGIFSPVHLSRVMGAVAALGGSLVVTTSAAVSQEPRPDTGRVANGKLVTDTFEIHHEWVGDTLVLSIRSDLPDDASVMVSVDRHYWEQGASDTYLLPYLPSHKSRIGIWEDQKHRVVVDDRSWMDSLQAHQRQMARIGMGFQVARIDDSIRVGFTVPINQDDPRFGRRNSNLVGDVVQKEGLAIVEKDLALSKPLGEAPEPSPWVSHGELKPGGRYVLTEGAPLMPALEPADPLAAAAAAKQLPAQTRVAVRDVRSKGGTPWYRVRATGPEGQDFGEGWINSTALIGQDIRRRNP